jgi:hypothetical protein
MDISFDCPGCGQHLVIDEAGAGLVVQCPQCARDVTVPHRPGTEPASSAAPSIDSREDKERTVALKWIPPTGNADGRLKK